MTPRVKLAMSLDRDRTRDGCYCQNAPERPRETANNGLDGSY